MEKFFKYAAAAAVVGGLGYVAYRAATKKCVVSIKIEKDKTPPVQQPGAIQAAINTGGLEALNLTSFENLWRSAGSSKTIERSSVCGQRRVFRVGSANMAIVEVDGRLWYEQGEMWVGSGGRTTNDSVEVAGAISKLQAIA